MLRESSVRRGAMAIRLSRENAFYARTYAKNTWNRGGWSPRLVCQTRYHLITFFEKLRDAPMTIEEQQRSARKASETFSFYDTVGSTASLIIATSKACLLVEL